LALSVSACSGGSDSNVDRTGDGGSGEGGTSAAGSGAGGSVANEATGGTQASGGSTAGTGGGNAQSGGGNAQSGGSTATAGNAGTGGALATGGTGVPTPPPPPPKGTVPMFIAAGQGGRTITSCDDGMTWVANHQYENKNEDHSPYTHKGLAYGDGKFIVILAWGANVSLKTSTNGVDWTRDMSFGGGFYGGIGYGGGRFAMLRQNVTQYSPTGDKPWTRAKVQPTVDFREGGGGGGPDKGVFAGGSDNTDMSWDGAQTWRSTGCPTLGFSGIGQEGGIAYGNNTLVLVGGNGTTCRLRDNGADRKVGSLGTAIRGKLFFTGGAFWIGNGDHGFTSTDGETWTRVAFTPKVSIHAIARGDSGTYVGVENSGGKFYRSTDGKNWAPAQGPAGPSLFRVVFGYGSPSETCKAP